VELSKKFVDLHAKYAPYIMERFKLATTTGEPVNVPLWWIAPNDKIAQEIDDEFLLGDKILSAPIVEEGS
jgi:myogenesis-regulating glycosidase